MKNVAMGFFCMLVMVACGGGGGDGGSGRSAFDSIPAGPPIKKECGNGIIEEYDTEEDGLVVHIQEQCDDSNLDNFDGCTNDCKAEFCGDRVIQDYLGEECDIGKRNADRDSVCSSDCKRRNICANGPYGRCAVVHKADKEPCTSGTEYVSDIDGESLEYLANRMAYSSLDIVVCEGTYHVNLIINGCSSNIAGFDPPDIHYQSNGLHPATGKQLDGMTPPAPAETDTILVPRATNQHTVQLRHGCSVRGSTAAQNSAHNSILQGFRIMDNMGEECVIHVNSKTPDEHMPCAGVRLYCTSDWIVRDNAIGKNRIGLYVKDTDKYWNFNTQAYGNDIYGNIEGVRFQYGNHNYLFYNFIHDNNIGVRILDGQYHSVYSNNMDNYQYNVYIDSWVYPKESANAGTAIYDNNFYERNYEYDNYSSDHWRGNHYLFSVQPSYDSCIPLESEWYWKYMEFLEDKQC